ncbi:unnamed protein product [Caenorhabditis sp. 36 PRJEB53466]|nr:unnamed protein product [Caenorhabditis sp. 36 PRJEB53466]
MVLPPDALEENVYAFALAKDQVHSYCNHCLISMSEPKKCSACMKLAYCSQDCQKSDWRLHRAECKSIQDTNEVANDSIRLVQRIAVMLSRSEDGKVEADYIPGGTRSFLTLEDHGNALDSEADEFATDFVKFAVYPPNIDLVKTIFKKVSINSFVIGNSTGNAIGIGLCIKLSAANHSCKPTTRVCYKNRTAMLVPVCDQEVPTTLQGACHSYIDELMPKAMRKEALKKKYKFDCACDGCCDEERNARMEAWSCGICTGGWMRNSQDGLCELCGWQMTQDHYELCRTAEETAMASRAKFENEMISMAQRTELGEKLLELFKDTLHTFNVHRLPVLRFMYFAALAAKDIGLAARMGVTLLSIMLEYQSETDPAVLFQKYQLAQLFCAAGAINEAKKMIGDIKEPLERIYTAESAIVRNVYCMIVKIRNAN